MPRRLKPCIDCGVPTRGTRCRTCAAQLAGYSDPAYRRARAELLAAAARCAICGQPPTAGDPLTADHITPLAEHGTHHRTNLRAAHRSCNSRRGARRA